MNSLNSIVEIFAQKSAKMSKLPFSSKFLSLNSITTITIKIERKTYVKFQLIFRSLQCDFFKIIKMSRRTRRVKINENTHKENEIEKSPSDPQDEAKVPEIMIKPPSETTNHSPRPAAHRPSPRHRLPQKNAEIENDEQNIENKEDVKNERNTEKTEPDKPDLNTEEIIVEEKLEASSDSEKNKIENKKEPKSHKKTTKGREILFTCKREENMKTKKFTFLDTDNSTVLFKAKTKKGFGEKTVFINEGSDDVHIDGFHKYTMVISNGSRSYNLWNDTKSFCLMEANVKKVKEPLKYGRFFEVSIPKENGEVIELKTEMPHLSSSGKYVLTFGPTFIVDSIKNAILIDALSQRRIIVTKVGEDILNVKCIENEEYIDPLILFAFAIISWMCPY